MILKHQLILDTENHYHMFNLHVDEFHVLIEFNAMIQVLSTQTCNRLRTIDIGMLTVMPFDPWYSNGILIASFDDNSGFKYIIIDKCYYINK